MRVSKVAPRHPISTQRKIKRPLAHHSDLSDQDLVRARDYLMETRDFDNVSAPKLVCLHERMPDYIQSCVTDRDFNRAREGEQLRQDLQIELHREAELLNSRRLSVRPDLALPRFTQPSPQYF
jgi:hypothetical protein